MELEPAEERIPGFKCTQCGKCCLGSGAGIQAGAADIARWRKNPSSGRRILQYVDQVLGVNWISPLTGKKMRRCPWLRKRPNRDEYRCLIYRSHPNVCRNYPINIDQAQEQGCPGVSQAVG